MPEKLSNNSTDSVLPNEPLPRLIPPEIFSKLVPFNFIPIAHLVAVILVPTYFLESSWARIFTALILLYLLPPLAARLVCFVSPPDEGELQISSRSFLSWWILFQIQMVFCRVPVLEELLRLIPGLYSAWLRLWGSRIGSFVFWGAGTQVIDRSFLNIGDRVATGAGVRLVPHVFQQDKDNQFILSLGTINLGSDSLVGGYSLITAGCTIPAGCVTHAYALLSPFSVWRPLSIGKRGKRYPGWPTDATQQENENIKR